MTRVDQTAPPPPPPEPAIAQAHDPALYPGGTTDTEWRSDGVPVSRRFDDPYFSIADGLAETRHVFLAGNGLPERLTEGFHIAELGFGTGLNMLAALMMWRASGLPGALRYTSFEAFPLRATEIARALDAFPEVRAIAAPFLDAWAEAELRAPAADRSFCLPGLEAQVLVGDARMRLPQWPGRADAWFLDGFAPARNPELWEADLMAAVAAHTAPDGTAATYTAAGHVRRALQAAGFQVERRQGFGRKRHMTVGRAGDGRQGAQATQR